MSLSKLDAVKQAEFQAWIAWLREGVDKGWWSFETIQFVWERVQTQQNGRES